MTGVDYSSKHVIHQVSATILFLLLLPVTAFAGLTISDGTDTLVLEPKVLEPKILEPKVLEPNRDEIPSNLVEPFDTPIGRAHQGSGQLTLTPKSTRLTVILESSLEPFVDEFGGYGSEIYATVDFFQIAREANGDNALWLGWQNRYDIEAISLSAPHWRIEISEPTAAPDRQHIELTYNGTGEKDILIQYIQTPRERQSLTALGLEPALLRGYWQPFRSLCLMIWSLLTFLYTHLGSWGFAIIALSFLVRLLTIPITKISLDYQNVALEQQNRINARVAEIKKTYSGIELSEQMVALYDRENYDHFAPFKGMLGLFIQIPILIALFAVIGDMSTLRDQSFLWIADLSLSDRLFTLGFTLPFFGGYFNLLPFLMAAATLLSTWVAAYRADNDISATSLYGMSLVFFIFFYSFPAALVLYWFTSNLFQLFQQLLEMAYAKAKTTGD